jgi:hypothetical protein
MKTGFNINPDAPKDFLFVGSPGTGKSSLALRFPDPYVLDCDNNLTPAVAHTKITNFKYDIAVLDDDGELIPPASRYAKAVERLNAAAADPSIKTIIIDSLTAFCDILISEVKRQAGIKEDGLMRIQDWGTFAYLLKHIIITMKACGKHIIWIGHHRVEQDEADKSFKTFLLIPGQNAFIVSGMFSNVLGFYYKVNGVPPNTTTELRVRTGPTSINDMRGLKAGLGDAFVGDFDAATAIKKILELVK